MFPSQFCYLSINKLPNPEPFQEYRNKHCEREEIVQINLEADLDFFKMYRQSNLKSTLQLRNGHILSSVSKRRVLNDAVIQLMNLLVDETLNGNSNAPLEKQRKRAKNVKKVISLAFAFFQLVSEKVTAEILNNELCSQLSNERQINQRLKEEHVPSGTAQR